MATKEALERAKKNYRKKCKAINVEFSESEMDLYEYMESHLPKQRYIKDLIRQDMEKGKH